MNVSAQLTRNSGLRARVNRKVATTTADNNKEGDVQVMEFGIISHHCSIQGMMIWYAMCLSSVIGSAASFPRKNADRLKTFGIKLGSDAT